MVYYDFSFQFDYQVIEHLETICGMKIIGGQFGIQWEDVVTLARDDIAGGQKIQTVFATIYK